MFAAASLKNALDAIADDFTRKTGQQVIISYGATPALARQIENGAPADVFVSADEDWMDYAVQRQLLKPGTRRNVIGNALVLIGPASPPNAVAIVPGLDWLAMLGPGGRLAVADPRAVPAGKYAQAALEKLGAWAALEPRLARAENVRLALQLVARGEAPLGIVYASDQHAEPRTQLLATFSADLHAPIVYPAAVIVTSRHASAGHLVAALSEPSAQVIFLSNGFKPLPRPKNGS
ncbi:MAG: molybdate ABC transporter substrate-binding protein [Hyphomicrobiales bacterium]|nr:molybdate ABC transporter substrate-binding protein [Hyphomicrobiales bacterium]